MKLNYLPIPLILGGLISACGGGGSSGSVGVGSAPSAALTSSNQVVAAQEATSTAFMPMLGAQTLTGARITNESALFSIARDQLNKLPGYTALAQDNASMNGVITSETIPCDVSGSLTISVSDPDNNGIVSAGDSLTISSNSCVQPEGALAGTLEFVFNDLTGVLGTDNYSASMALTFGNFSITNAGLSASVNGSLALSVAVTGPNSSTETLSTPALSVTGSYAGQTHSRSLTNYSATATTVPDATYGSLTRYNLSGLLTSSALSSQAISFATSTPFVRRAPDLYPYDGVMVIGGANNSKISLTVLSTTQVKQELDANGDGVYEDSITVAWDSLI